MSIRGNIQFCINGAVMNTAKQQLTIANSTTDVVITQNVFKDHVEHRKEANIKTNSEISQDPAMTSINQNTYLEEPRKRKQQDVMSKILPMLVMPFMMAMTMLPMLLTGMKFSLIQALIMGKLAIVVGVINLLRNMGDKGGLYSHNIHLGGGGGHGQSKEAEEISMAHYGYTGGDEYGAYVNKRRKRK